MTHAPRSVVFVIGPAWNRYPTPTQYPAKRKEPPWPIKQAIPSWDREALRRRVEEMRRMTRPQVEALRGSGRRFRAASVESELSAILQKVSGASANNSSWW
jgi:hypothetical protein